MTTVKIEKFLDVSDGMPDRYRGALLGLAAGDALGTTLEFTPKYAVKPLTDIVGGGPFSLKPGEWTDDTSMMLCLAESLVLCGGFDPRDQLNRYVEWWTKGKFSVKGRCFDIGCTTSAALSAINQKGATVAREYGAGNGSLMRLAPVPLAYAHNWPDVLRYCEASSDTTHSALECREACQLYGTLIANAVNHGPKLDKGDLLAFVGKMKWEAVKIRNVAAGSYRTKTDAEIRGSGYVVTTLEAALWAFASTDDFRAGALKVVNLGEDSDTTGAVYGQLAGAYYGASAIPAGWREKLAMRETIEKFADGLLTLRRTLSDRGRA